MRLIPILLGLAAAGALCAAPALADEAKIERARALVEARCFLCHGTTGESSSEVFPRLAGQHAAYLSKQLADFQSGRRKSATMNEMAKALTPEEIEGLGLFFARQRVEPHPAGDLDFAVVGRFLYQRGNTYSGVAPCAGCHGPRGEGTPTLPRIAGQHALYTESQLRQFHNRERNNDNAVMHAVASKLTEFEIKALSEFLAALP